MTRLKAQKYRQELISERIVFAEEDDTDNFGRAYTVVLRGD